MRNRCGRQPLTWAPLWQGYLKLVASNRLFIKPLIPLTSLFKVIFSSLGPPLSNPVSFPSIHVESLLMPTFGCTLSPRSNHLFTGGEMWSVGGCSLLRLPGFHFFLKNLCLQRWKLSCFKILSAFGLNSLSPSVLPTAYMKKKLSHLFKKPPKDLIYWWVITSVLKWNTPQFILKPSVCIFTVCNAWMPIFPKVGARQPTMCTVNILLRLWCWHYTQQCDL